MANSERNGADVYGECDIEPAKTAEPIELWFGTVSVVGHTKSPFRWALCTLAPSDGDSSNTMARHQCDVNQIIAGVAKLARRAADGGAEYSVGINWKEREARDSTYVMCIETTWCLTCCMVGKNAMLIETILYNNNN